MPWLEKIQNKSREEKIRIIWITVVTASVLMIILWIFTSKIGKSMPKDTTLFHEIGQGVKDIHDNYRK